MDKTFPTDAAEMRRLGQIIKQQLPENIGFALFVF